MFSKLVNFSKAKKFSNSVNKFTLNPPMYYFHSINIIILNNVIWQIVKSLNHLLSLSDIL